MNNNINLEITFDDAILLYELIDSDKFFEMLEKYKIDKNVAMIFSRITCDLEEKLPVFSEDYDKVLKNSLSNMIKVNGNFSDSIS